MQGICHNITEEFGGYVVLLVTIAGRYVIVTSQPSFENSTRRLNCTIRLGIFVPHLSFLLKSPADLSHYRLVVT